MVGERGSRVRRRCLRASQEAGELVKQASTVALVRSGVLRSELDRDTAGQLGKALLLGTSVRALRLQLSRDLGQTLSLLGFALDSALEERAVLDPARLGCASLDDLRQEFWLPSSLEVGMRSIS